MDFFRFLPRLYTLEEFLTLEASGEQRHEYLEGQVVVTEPNSLAHNPLKAT